MGLGAGVAPELRKLLESIEAWPGNVSNVRQATEKAMGRLPPPSPPPAKAVLDDPDLVEANGDDEEGQDALDEHMARTARYQEAPRNCVLTSSLRAPGTCHLSSMVSAVPQRDQEWRRSALGPGLGPGSYSVVRQACELAEPERASTVFRSTLPQRPAQLGVTGEPPAPDGMYAHSVMPTKPHARIPAAASTFSSLSYRFGAEDHVRHVILRQQPKIPRRPIHHWHGAPSWEGPFKPMDMTRGAGGDAGEHAQVLVMPPGPDHADRLAAARASVLPPAEPA